MKFLQQIILMFGVSSISFQAFAHTGAHDMGIVEGMLHFVSSPNHMGSLITVIFAVVGLNIYWVWTR